MKKIGLACKTGSPLVVAIVDRDSAQRDNLAQQLQKYPGMLRVQACANILDVLEPSNTVHVVVLDIESVDAHTRPWMALLKSRHPQVKVILLTAGEDHSLPDVSWIERPDGVLCRPLDTNIFCAALWHVHSGGVALCQKTADWMCEWSMRHSWNPHSTSFNESDNALMELLAAGCLYKEIADRMQITFSAAKSRVSRLFKRLQVSNRTAAIQRWQQQIK